MAKQIDIKKLTKNTPMAKRLFQFFNASPRKVWHERVTFKLDDGTSIFFPDTIVQRECKDPQRGVRYEVIDKHSVLANEDKSSVFRIKATVSIDSDGSIKYKEPGPNAKNKLGRVIKVQWHNKKNPKRLAVNECKMAGKHLHMKQATFFAEESSSSDLEICESYLVMREQKGLCLVDLWESSNPKNLNKHDRLEISRTLLSALKLQVTDVGIIHRDIKLENIIIDRRTKPPSVSILDYAYGVNIEQLDDMDCGTPGYYAPEGEAGEKAKEFGPRTAKMDVFSMGITLALLWGADERIFGRGSLDRVLFPSLFEKLQLSKENQQAIHTILRGMVHRKVADRITLEQAIEQFDAIDLAPNSVKKSTLSDSPSSLFKDKEKPKTTMDPSNAPYKNERLG